MGFSDRFLPLITPLTSRLVSRGALFLKPMTLGVRVLLTLPDGRIVLVRHSYVAGWYMPGGGVEPGETLAGAARREVREETGHRDLSPLRLFGMYLNSPVSRRDHVALFVAEARDNPVRPPGGEIAAIEAFARDVLPEGTTAATLRRIAEVFDAGAPMDEVW